jgi:hypothetical protein
MQIGKCMKVAKIQLKWKWQVEFKISKTKLGKPIKNKMCNFIWDVKDNDPSPKHRLPQKKKIQSTYRIVEWAKIVNTSMCVFVEM